LLVAPIRTRHGRGWYAVAVTPIETYWPVLVPLLIEGLWLVFWLPRHVRRHRGQLPGEESRREVWWNIAFVVYHLPSLPLVYATISKEIQNHHHIAVMVFVMVVTVLVYTAIVASAYGL
jgi:hypothetical protein